jgi:hypothetical protein
LVKAGRSAAPQEWLPKGAGHEPLGQVSIPRIEPDEDLVRAGRNIRRRCRVQNTIDGF